VQGVLNAPAQSLYSVIGRDVRLLQLQQQVQPLLEDLFAE
jgi:hypothetical protein